MTLRAVILSPEAFAALLWHSEPGGGFSAGAKNLWV
jgi:multisubunit Na+/H+ antiporter MnhB subunit